MNQQEFVQEKERMICRILNEEDFYENATLNRTFNLVSANLLNFLPGMPASSHSTFFKNLMLNKSLSVLEQRYDSIMKDITYEGVTRDFFTLVNRTPVIFCTFHMGSSRVVNHFLASNQIPFSVVMADHISSDEGDEFKDMYGKIYKKQAEDRLDIIQAKQPNAAIGMLRELRKGRSLLIYVDGNTGTGDDSIRNKNRMKIEFLNNFIYARIGLGYLSQIAEVPIVPIICFRKSIDEICLKFYPAIFSDKLINRQLFAQNVTKHLYGLFLPLLERYPEQWEGWLYFHTIADVGEIANCPIKQKLRYKLNINKYGYYSVNTEYFLFDKLTYNSYPIDISLYQLLLRALKGFVVESEMNEDVFRQLYSNHVLLPIIEEN